MGSLVPDFILNNYINNKLTGNFEAYTVFVDISGFTPMTESLMLYGKEGAEVLSRIIKYFFTASIKAVHENGGFVSSFAGDAFTAIFQVKQAEYALNSAFNIIEIFKQYGLSRTRFGDFKLNVKVGLSYGPIEYHIIESDTQNTFFSEAEP